VVLVALIAARRCAVAGCGLHSDEVKSVATSIKPSSAQTKQSAIATSHAARSSKQPTSPPTHLPDRARRLLAPSPSTVTTARPGAPLDLRAQDQESAGYATDHARRTRRIGNDLGK
jgi:hypothetical protein